MLKICDTAIAEPLSIILNNCINQSMFPDIWKKSNICPTHIKGYKQLINNQRLVLLPICGKIFERIIFGSLYEYVEENKVLSVHQSGFWANDSCVNQLLLVVLNLYKAFDAYPTLETCDIFLDMSKSLGKVRHQGLILKLKYTEVSDFFFKLFADDTSLFSAVYDSNVSANVLNNDLQKISNWAYEWKVSFNPDLNKKEVIFYRKYHPDYGDIIYDQPNNKSFTQKNWKNSIQCYPSNY